MAKDLITLLSRGYNQEFKTRIRNFARAHRGLAGSVAYSADNLGAYFSAEFATGDGLECHVDRSAFKCANPRTNRAMMVPLWKPVGN